MSSQLICFPKSAHLFSFHRASDSPNIHCGSKHPNANTSWQTGFYHWNFLFFSINHNNEFATLCLPLPVPVFHPSSLFSALSWNFHETKMFPASLSIHCNMFSMSFQTQNNNTMTKQVYWCQLAKARASLQPYTKLCAHGGVRLFPSLRAPVAIRAFSSWPSQHMWTHRPSPPCGHVLTRRKFLWPQDEDEAPFCVSSRHLPRVDCLLEGLKMFLKSQWFS